MGIFNGYVKLPEGMDRYHSEIHPDGDDAKTLSIQHQTLAAKDSPGGMG